MNITIQKHNNKTIKIIENKILMRIKINKRIMMQMGKGNEHHNGNTNKNK